MRTILLFCITVLLCVNIYSKDNAVKNKQKLQKILSNDAVTYLDINNILTPVYNDGKSSASLEYPKGSGNAAVYTEGILWGGFVANDPQVRVGGAEYSSGLQAGIIKPDGTADDPALAKYRAFRVRPDVYPGGPDVDLTQDAAYEHTDAATLRAQYEKDWNEWPANEGAPYTDVNKDNVYEPGTDIPGVPGADQTIWYVCNDMNSSLVNNLLGTAPLGIELQTTVWAYKLDGALNDTYFKKYKIINKGNQNYTFDSTFISLWVDTDLGSSTDDYCGSDSTLSLIYAYNGYPVDAVYSSPPTVGFYLIQGPVVKGKSGDTAFVGGRYVPGKKNLPMTASYFFISGSNGFGDPPSANVQGANQFYNFFNGEYGASGQPFQDPWGNKTKFVFPGDPVTGNGWTENQSFTPSDIRQGMASGPVNIAPGDTQEVVFAEMIAGKINPVDSYLTGITNLKNNYKYAAKIYRIGVMSSITALSIANTNNPVSLKAGTLPNNGQVSSLTWSITKKPTGSNAVIANTSAISTSFTPDLDGDYEVTLQANINGIQTSDAKTIKSVSNHAPVAVLTVDKQEITSKDSVLLSFDKSSDPDADNLSFNLNGRGFFKFQNTSKTAYYYPSPDFLGNTTISLLVSDLYTYDSTGANVKVNPWLQDIDIKFSFIDPDCITKLNGQPYFKGSDSLYIPLVNSLKRYNIKNDGIELNEEVSNLKLTGVFAIENNLLYGSVNLSPVYFGTIGKLSIYDLNNNYAPLLSNYLPGSTDIYSFYRFDSDTYLRDYDKKLYKMDFTNISSPQILATGQIQLNNLTLFKHDNQYLYFLGATTDDNTYYVKMLDRTNLSTVNSLRLPFNQSYSLVVYDTILVAYKSYLDSLYICSFDGKTQPVLLRKINFSSLFPNPFPYFYGQGNFYVKFMDRYLEIDSYSSSKLFDIGDLNNIKTVAACLGGGMSYYKKGSNYYLMSSDPRSVTISNPYSGINGVNLSKITGINRNPNIISIPASYSLYQNYPNPFNPSTIISYSVPVPTVVTIKIYDVLGREVSTLLNEEMKAGNYKISFNAGSLASGVYYYKMKAGDFVQVKKMLLLK